jgi:hypothetical protein
MLRQDDILYYCAGRRSSEAWSTVVDGLDGELIDD